MWIVGTRVRSLVVYAVHLSEAKCDSILFAAPPLCVAALYEPGCMSGTPREGRRIRRAVKNAKKHGKEPRLFAWLGLHCALSSSVSLEYGDSIDLWK